MSSEANLSNVLVEMQKTRGKAFIQTMQKFHEIAHIVVGFIIFSKPLQPPALDIFVYSQIVNLFGRLSGCSQQSLKDPFKAVTGSKSMRKAPVNLIDGQTLGPKPVSILENHKDEVSC